MKALSIIVPTIGRASLTKTLLSIANQAQKRDEIIIVHDYGPSAFVNQVMKNIQFRAEVKYHELAHFGGHWGHTARNYALDNLVTREVVASIDDDDMYLPGAFQAMRNVRMLPMVFSCVFQNGVGLWDDAVVRMGNVATPMFAVPSSAKSRWGSAYEGDFQYAVELKKEFGDLVWSRTVIAEIGGRFND